MTKLAADKLAELILDIFAQLLDITSSLYGIHETYNEQCNCRQLGRFDDEIEMQELVSFPGVKVENIKLLVDRFVFPVGHGIIILASGRLCLRQTRLKCRSS